MYKNEMEYHLKKKKQNLKSKVCHRLYDLSQPIKLFLLVFEILNGFEVERMIQY